AVRLVERLRWRLRLLDEGVGGAPRVERRVGAMVVEAVSFLLLVVGPRQIAPLFEELHALRAYDFDSAAPQVIVDEPDEADLVVLLGWLDGQMETLSRLVLVALSEPADVADDARERVALRKPRDLLRHLRGRAGEPVRLEDVDARVVLPPAEDGQRVLVDDTEVKAADE